MMISCRKTHTNAYVVHAKKIIVYTESTDPSHDHSDLQREMSETVNTSAGAPAAYATIPDFCVQSKTPRATANIQIPAKLA